MRLARWWIFGAFLTAVVVISLVSVSGATGAGGGDDDEVNDPTPVHGKDVGGGKKQWVFVFRYPTHDGSSGSNQCVDGDQSATLPQFANPNPSGMRFTFYRGGIPQYVDKLTATGAVVSSFSAWDAINPASVYFDIVLNDTAKAPGFKLDRKNTIGWRKMGAGTLAAVSAWSDTNGNVLEADLYYNSLYGWHVFSAACDPDAPNSFDIQGIGTHEVAHVLGKHHLADEHQQATAYPSAWPKEIKKRTITTGERNSGIP